MDTTEYIKILGEVMLTNAFENMPQIWVKQNYQRPSTPFHYRSVGIWSIPWKGAAKFTFRMKDRF